MRELTKAEISYLQMYVEYVRKLGGKDVGTKAVYDLMHPNDSYSYSYGTKGRKISKAFQKADQYGYLDVKWDGRRYLASLPLTNETEDDTVQPMDGDIYIELDEDVWFKCSECGKVKPEAERDSTYHIKMNKTFCPECLDKP